MIKLLFIEESYKGSVQNAFNIPREIGCYSVGINPEIDIHFDSSLMKYYFPREDENLCLDLNLGYENTLKLPYNPVKLLDNLAKWITHHSAFEMLDSVDFVTSRGTIQKLLCTPYCRIESQHWMICARKIGNVIYFRTFDTDETIAEELNATDEMKRLWAWGYKFENYMTTDHPGGVPDTSSITHEIENYNTVFTNKIGSYDLLMNAEIDGINPSKSSRLRNGDTSCYMELKTSKFIPDFSSSYPFKKYKSLQWWAQSVIVGVEENVCGLRDDDGIVRFIANFKTKELPFMCQDFWNPDVCFTFCNNFLKYLTWKVKNDPRIVYKFEYTGGPRVLVSTLRDPEERFQVIPEWFLAELEKYEGRKKI